jgi:hypothetical protein
MMAFFCASLLQLTVETHDFSQDETKIIVVKN